MKRFKYILKSLINNKVIVEGRKRHALEAIVIFLISMILAIVPSFVSSVNVKGAAFLNGNTNSVDEAMIAFSTKLNETKVNLTIQKEGKTNILVIDENEWANFIDIEKGFNDKNNPNNSYYSYRRYNDNLEVERLHVYYINGSLEDLKNKNNELQQQSEGNPISYLLLGKEATYMVLYGHDNVDWSKPQSTSYINYKKIAPDTSISDFTTIEDWKAFFNKGYEGMKWTNIGIQISLFVGLNIFVAFFMVLMIFIVTRGKRNPYRDYKFSEAMKIVGVSSLSPAILTCLLGFIFPSLANLMFMLFLGVRTMWLTSKQLSYVRANNNNVIDVQNVKEKKGKKKSKDDQNFIDVTNDKNTKKKK